MENLPEIFLNAIKMSLKLCDPVETPVVCSMMNDKEAYELLVQAIAEKVLMQKIEIAQAIIQLNNEFDINGID